MFGYCSFHTFYPIESLEYFSEREKFTSKKCVTLGSLEGTKFGTRRLQFRDRRVQLVVIVCVYVVVALLHGCQ